LGAARFPACADYGNFAAQDMIWRKKNGHDPKGMAVAVGTGSGLQRALAVACAVAASGVGVVTPPPSAL